jgi:hypothetical protein
MTVYDINWDDNFLPLYGSTITIPENTILWRGYDPQYSAISDRPAYYGSKEFAKGYADKYDTAPTPFITTRSLELVDIRYMKVLLSQLFQHNQLTEEDNTIISATTISFGLCSLQHQIKLFKDRYRAIYTSSDKQYNSIKTGIKNLEAQLNPNAIYEQQGYRIAETTNDAIVMGFIKEIFNNHYDGYISPNILSPFHVEKKQFKINSEIVLFSPKDSGIKILNAIPDRVQKQTINWCILRYGRNYTTIRIKNMSTSYYIKKGGANDNTNTNTDDNTCDDYNHLCETKHKTILKTYNEGVKIGKKWTNRQIRIESAIAPGPTVDPSIFM